jgi:hypothetical protein
MKVNSTNLSTERIRNHSSFGSLKIKMDNSDYPS